MEDRTLAIPIAFILLAALLCWMLIGAKGKWWLKLATILIVPGFGLAVWGSISSYKGWPTASEPPEKALLVGGIVREPDAKKDDPGAIYLWLIPLKGDGHSNLNPLDYVSSGAEPRSYKLPYTRQLHDAVNDAQAAEKDGRPMLFQRTGKKNGRGGARGNSQDDSAEGDESGASGTPGGGSGNPEEGEYKFYDLPLPTSQPKP